MKFLVVAVIIAAFVAVALAEDETVAATKYKTKESSGTAARDKLLDDLFTNYKKINYPENSTVSFGVSLLNVDFDTDHNIMKSNIWFRSAWTDSRFSWDPEAVGIKVMRVPSDQIWTPDVMLYNGHQDMNCVQTNALIYSNGKVIWVPPCEIRSFCNLTLTNHPYDQQECTLKFGSWTFDGLTMGLEFFDKIAKTDVDYFSSGHYKVTKNVAVREEKFYDCCVEPYLSLKYDLGFTRRAEGANACA